MGARRARQRHRDRARVRPGHFFSLSTRDLSPRVRRRRHRIDHLQESGPTPWRENLGRVEARGGPHFKFLLTGHEGSGCPARAEIPARATTERPLGVKRRFRDDKAAGVRSPSPPSCGPSSRVTMANPINLLLVEDDLGDAEVIQRMLSRSSSSRFDIEWVHTLQDAVLALPGGRFNVLLLDLGLLGMRRLGGTLSNSRPQRPCPHRDRGGSGRRGSRAASAASRRSGLPRQSSLTTAGLVHSIHYSIERHRLVRQLAESQTNLRNRNRRLEKLCRTAYKFVDNVSHEFRTPLAVIKEYTALIRDGIVGDVSEEQRQLLTVVEDRADDLNMIVDDMLDVSKLEAGLLGVHREECSAAEIVSRVRPALERRAATKSVRLEWDVAADLPSTYCDSDKARRALINLTINALKFCGDPGRVRMRLPQLPKCGGHRVQRHRQRAGHQPGRSAVLVPPFHATDQIVPHQQLQRLRLGAEHRQGFSGGKSGRDSRRKHAGPGQHILVYAASGRFGRGLATLPAWHRATGKWSAVPLISSRPRLRSRSAKGSPTTSTAFSVIC